MHLTADHIILRTAEQLHIYALTGGHATVPATPLGASLATVFSLHRPPAPGSAGNLHCKTYLLPFDQYNRLPGTWHDAHALANYGPATPLAARVSIAATRKHLLYVTERGALVVLANYHEILPSLLQKGAAKVASANSLLVACYPLLCGVQACGDRIVLLTVSIGIWGSAFGSEIADTSAMDARSHSTRMTCPAPAACARPSATSGWRCGAPSGRACSCT